MTRIVNVLITGGCGYVGTKLTQAVLDRTPHNVTVVDTQWFGNYLPADPRLTVRRLDVRQIDEVDLAPFDTIFHLANIANDPAVELNPYLSWEINVLATMRLADRAARQGVRHLIFASSGSVYGVRTELRVTEDLTLVPISEYNKTKMVAERVILSYADEMKTTIIRPATTCGCSPRMRLDLTVNLLTMQALTKGAMTVFGGAQVRPSVHIDDLVDLYLFVADRGLTGIYNAGFEDLTVLDIANRIAAAIPVEITMLPPNDPRSYRLCSDRLLAAGFTPKKNVAVAIGELADAYRSGRLTDEPAWHNVAWMKQHGFADGPTAVPRT
jgi:nucleoside-diphosphate-sugar epimerase